jgi:hypothetical protein
MITLVVIGALRLGSSNLDYLDPYFFGRAWREVLEAQRSKAISAAAALYW